MVGEGVELSRVCLLMCGLCDQKRLHFCDDFGDDFRSRLADMYLYVILSVSCINRNENNRKYVLCAGSCM
jgi:hypothetical protein